MQGCVVCKQGFTTLIRRHQCRKCGFAVCATHSKKNEIVNADDNMSDTTLQRVCDGCCLGSTLLCVYPVSNNKALLTFAAAGNVSKLSELLKNTNTYFNYQDSVS